MNKTKFIVDEKYRKQAENFVATIRGATLQGCIDLGGDIRIFYYDSENKLQARIIRAENN